MAYKPGEVIDGFRLEEHTHEGGMASLWRVTRKADDPPMMMKLPHLRYGDDATAIVGFEVEQMILRRLAGPHIARYIASADFSRQAYLVMEYVPGPSLRARLEDAPLPPATVAELGAKVAAALHDLHRQHVIHLDLKPSSVLFRPTGEAVLIDFGLSFHDRLPDLLAEQFHLPMGTGPYISPEQVLGVRNDPRSDLFALGVTLYHLATGERPFGNPSSIIGLRRRLFRAPAPPRALDPNFPGWLQEIILHCLEVDPNKRYATAAQVGLDLQNPEQVALTERAQRVAREGMLRTGALWLRALGSLPTPQHSVAEQLAQAPIVMAAVDVSEGGDALREALRVTVRRILQTEPAARLACVHVRKTARIGMDVNVDPSGQSLHVKGLVALKHWARELGIAPDRITYQVLEAPDAATALIEYAQNNDVDHILIGARGSSSLRRYMGSVSTQVVAEAPCTVTVVRAHAE